MSELITRTARLVPYAKRPKQVPSFVTAYSYEPMPNEATSQLGSFFVIIEVLVGGRSSEEVADLIIETVGNHYYNHHSPDHTSPLDRFESAIKAVNQELVEYVNQGNAAWIGKLSAVVAVQAEGELHLSQTGSAEAFLYRGKASTRITGQGPARPSVPSKTFGSIVSGGLEVGDRLLLATPALVHQVALSKLKSVISQTSPNQSIAEITKLLKESISERVAALIIEATTPELAALQVRSETPNEIQLGSPENVVEAAKLAAAPLAHATITSSQRARDFTRRTWEHARPHLHQVGLRLINLLRQFLTGTGARQRVLITSASIIVALAGFWWWQQSQTRTQQLLTRYQDYYGQYQLADQAAEDGDKLGAKQLLSQLQTNLAKLAKTPGHQSLEAKLTSTKLPAGAPTSLSQFTRLVDTKLDALENLKRASPTTVASFTTIKDSLPTHMEYNSGRAYIIDSKNNNALYIVNTTTNEIRKSSSNTSRLGNVVSTTISSIGDGMYILTDKPSVWLYRFDNDSLIEQTIALGQWPAAKSLATYTNNLYLLSETAIYKHLRTSSGFSPKTSYLAASPANELSHATALAIDGSVYALSPSGLRQYVAGTLKATADVPTSLADSDRLRSIAGGDMLMAVNSTSRRLGFWSTTTTQLSFTHQYQLESVKALYDAAYDSKSKTVYALVDGRLVKFSP